MIVRSVKPSKRHVRGRIRPKGWRTCKLGTLSWGLNRLDVFAIRTADDAVTCIISRRPQTPVHGRPSISHGRSTAPSVVSCAPEPIDLFAIGVDHDVLETGDLWSNWEALNQTTVSIVGSLVGPEVDHIIYSQSEQTAQLGMKPPIVPHGVAGHLLGGVFES